jgi:hypothetical protein
MVTPSTGERLVDGVTIVPVYSLSPCRLVPQLQPSDPSVVGILDRIEAVDVGLDVEKRCLVEHIDPAHRERATRAFDKFYDRKADSIRTTRVPGRKDAVRFVIEWIGTMVTPSTGERLVDGVTIVPVYHSS